MRFTGLLMACVFASLPASPAQAAGAPAGVAPLRPITRTLPNGLRVILLPDRSAKLATVQVWYRVGSKYDPPGRSGFAHLFEHLMFKATRNMPSEMIDRLTEDVGGYDNAKTTDDYTSYVATVPANHLRRILWAEAERMGSLVVDEAAFRSERDVVKEELRQRVLASAYGRLSAYYVVQTAFDRHPYGRPGVGSVADLDAATVAEAKAFHAAYYRPDNAFLVVSGNFDVATAERWIRAYFGPLTRPTNEIPRRFDAEPKWTASRRFVVYEPNIPLPAVTLTFQVPAIDSADMPALMVLDAVLNEGESSRLNATLVRAQGIATGAGTRFFPSIEPGTLTLLAVLSKGVATDRAEAALRAITARLRNEPLSSAELAKAKAVFLAKARRARETTEGRGAEVGKAAVLLGDPEKADVLLAAVAMVTTADVRRVAQAYLRDDPSVAIHYMDKSAAKDGPAATPIATSPTLQILPLPSLPPDFADLVLAPPGQRLSPPPPDAQVPAQKIRSSEVRLGNGLRVVTLQKPGTGLVAINLVIASGSSADEGDQWGSAQLLARTILQGAGDRDAAAVARDIESAGATLTANAGWDATILSLKTDRGHLAVTVPIMVDAAIKPTLAPEDIDRERKRAIEEVGVNATDIRSVAANSAGLFAWQSAVYRKIASGTPESLARLDAAALSARHRAWSPSISTLVFTGDITPREARVLAERSFGAWRDDHARPTRSMLSSKPAIRATDRVILVDVPTATQPAITMVIPSVLMRDPKYPAALVANSVLAGGFSSRLNQEIRVRRGLSYGVSGSVDARMVEGNLIVTVATRNEVVSEVVSLLAAAVGQLAQSAVPDTELAVRKAAAAGRLARRSETTDGLGDVVADAIARGGSTSDVLSLDGRIDAVTPQQVLDVARGEPGGEKPVYIIAGDAKTLGGSLRKAYPSLVVTSPAGLRPPNAEKTKK